MIRTAIKATSDGCIAAGMLVQHLADGEEGRERLHARLDHPHWEHVSIIAQTIRHEELIDPEITLEAMIWRLFHEEREVRIDPLDTIDRGCRCSEMHFEEVLARFPSDDRKEMRNEQGFIVVGLCVLFQRICYTRLARSLPRPIRSRSPKMSCTGILHCA